MAPLFNDTSIRNNKTRRAVYFMLIILPGFFIGYFSYTSIKEQFNKNIKEKRLAVATLSAAVIQERLTNILNLGSAYASRPLIRSQVLAGNWKQTTEALDEIRRNSPIVDQIVLTDTMGNVKAETSEHELETERNVAASDWFTGIRKNQNQPYLSKVYKRNVAPNYNVVTAAMPVVNTQGQPIAYLGMQIRLKYFQTWADLTVSLGFEEFTIVDHAGQVVFHSGKPLQAHITSYAGAPSVQKVLSGETGVEMLPDPEDKSDKLTAYAPVKAFGWGVIVPQSVEAAYAERDQNLQLILRVFGVILLLNIVFAFFIIRNMVKLSRARKALKASEERYSLAMQGANDGLWDWNIKTNEVFFSPRWKSMLGYKEQEFPNNFEAWKEHLHPDDHTHAMETLQAYFDHKKPVYELEHRLRHKNGTYRWILARGKALWNDKGEPYRMVGFHTDLTDRKNMEEEMRQYQQFLNSIIENIPNMIVVKDAEDLKFKRFNKAGEELTGLKEKDVLDKKVHDLFPKDQADSFTANDLAVLKSGKMVDIPEEKIESKYKGIRVLHTKKIPITDKSGKPRYLLGISEDITEQKRTEQKIIQLNKELEKQIQELERTNQDLKDVTHSISHDLKAPLRGIEMLAEWLLTDSTDRLNKEEVKNLQLMVDRVKRMRNLIDGILRYARIGRTQSEKEEINLNNLISEITDMLSPPEHIKIEIADTLPYVIAEKAPVMQLFQNLLSNAIKYMDKPEGLIRVGAIAEDKYWKFYVSDNGPGIEKEYFQKIFQIFQTLKPKDEFESTGIGLTIVKKIVETYGGRVWLESELGKGTIFFVTLPHAMIKMPAKITNGSYSDNFV